MKRLLPAFALSLSLTAAAQQTKPQPYVFHAYPNLIQIPVLALTEYQQPIPSGTPMDFAVSIDGGPPFLVKHVRPEADDPITLSIVIDLSGDQKEIVPALSDVIGRLAPDILQPQDHVSIYAVDCQIIQTANNIPADKAGLMRAVDDAIHSTTPHHGDQQPRCPTFLHMWDTLSYVTTQLATQPGRRVILAVTDGHDNLSVQSWAGLREFANSSGVAIFGLSAALYARPDTNSKLQGTELPESTDTVYENHFRILAELSGGLVLRVNLPDLTAVMQQFVYMLRQRYIVEFPRPDSIAKGPHSFLVSVANTATSYFVRPAGISLPIADPTILADPNTIPSDPSKAPTPGSRRFLNSTH